jgi:bacterioferritin-associated ferredoxin
MKKLGKPQEIEFIVCRCENVYLADIQRAIEVGSDSVDELKLRTRAAMGVCQGRTCLRLLRRLLIAYGLSKGTAPAYRWPVRPVKMGMLKRDLPPRPPLQIPLIEVDLDAIEGE